MTAQSIRELLIQKLDSLSEQQLESIWQIIETLESTSPSTKTQYKEEGLTAKFDRLCQQTRALHIDNPITDEVIQAEIDAYRRGE